jgi:solute carrier family 35 (UDP-galactose transporter), member B1
LLSFSDKKASKPIPVMILGVLIGRKKYTLRKVILVLFIVGGVMLFMFKESYTEKDGENPLLGNSLIAVSLLMDGLTGATEDRMRSIAKPTAFNFMHYLNLWSMAYHIIGVLVFNEGPKFIDFVIRHPDIIKFFCTTIFVGTLGTVFISSMVANFGALPLSITTTVRKFFSVFLSVIIFHNVLSIRQWCAAAIIFTALFIDGVFSKKMSTNAVEPSKPNHDLEEAENKQKHETNELSEQQHQHAKL